MTRPTRRSFDLEYETLTKSLLVVYGDEAAAPKYRRRTASGWSGEGAAPALGSLRPYWIELARNPLRNEIALMIGDGGSNLGITTWDGNAWSQIRGVEFNLNTEEYKSFDLAYDNATATLLAAWGRLQPVDGGTLADMRYITRTIDGTFSPLKSLNNGAPPGPLVLAPEPGTSRIALSYLEYSCNRGGGTCDDFVAGIWTGTSFTANGALDGDTTTPYGGRVSTMVTGVAWLGTTGVAIAAYHRDLPNPGQLPFVRFAGNAWGTVSGADANPPLPPRASMQLVTAPGPSVVALVEDTNGSLWAKGYRETSGAGAWADVGGGAPLATGLVIAGGVPFGATTP